jgi:NADH-quinone oxidoreductase subunit G
MPKLIVDDEPIEVPQGTTVLQAVLRRGREIPHYCYHPGLSVSGNCRMCLVEVEKSPKLLIACATQAADGMVVRTETDRVKRARESMMEFFLINHPLDCPICDQAGECRLQEYAVEYGTGKSRFVETKLNFNKAVDIGPHVLLDQERCIRCSRCIRFCDEITGTGELAFFQRGERTMIGIYPGKALDNPYSGNVVDLCPVGALTLKEFRFQTRVWYLKNTPSVCAACARGCNVVVAVGTQQALMTTSGQQDDRIKRIVPRSNDEVNGHWMCDEGRLSYRRQQAASRIGRAEAPAGTAAEWDAAVSRAADLLRAAASRGRLAALLSPRLVCEDLFAWHTLLEKLGGGSIGVARIVRGEDDGLLIRADKGSNSTGAAWILGDAATVRTVVDRMARGEIDTLLVAGDTLDPAESPALDPSTRRKLSHVVFVGPFASEAGAGADVVIPSTSWAEEDGTMVNFEGRVQRVQRCHPPRGEARPGWRVVADLMASAQLGDPGWTAAREVFEDLAAAVPAFAGLTHASIGLLGTERAATGATR